MFGLEQQHKCCKACTGRRGCRVGVQLSTCGRALPLLPGFLRWGSGVGPCIRQWRRRCQGCQKIGMEGSGCSRQGSWLPTIDNVQDRKKQQEVLPHLCY